MQKNGFFSKTRLIIVGALAGFFSLVVLIRFTKLSFVKAPQMAKRIPKIERGSILDRNGKPLAVSTNFYNFKITPSKILEGADSLKASDAKSFKTPQESLVDFVMDMAEVFDIDPDQLIQDITQANDENRAYFYVSRKISESQKTEVERISQKYFKNPSDYGFDTMPGRVYPENDLASQLIGVMGTDGKGLEGIELSMDKILMPAQNPNVQEAVQGKNIYLTIDANLQYKLEQIAKESIQETQAENMIMIASDAKTGEILSYISLPSINLNDFSSTTLEQRKDSIARDGYEPGSVFKIFTIATAVDCGAIDRKSTYVCDGIWTKRTSGGETVAIKCLEHHGRLTVDEALKYSCNDVLAQIADEIDTNTFLSYLDSFGFGKKTGLQVPLETTGILKDQNDRYWSARSKNTIAIGQEISVNALQMVQGATIIANGGIPLPLTVIKKISDKEGHMVQEHKVQKKKRIIKESTAKYLLECMKETAETGTGHRANLSDIKIGVKTGTAQMADLKKGGYSDTDFIANCMSIFPIENPKIILYVLVKKPKGEYLSGRIVTPVVKKAASEIIDYMGISRDSASSLEHTGQTRIQEHPKISIGQEVPDFTGLPKRDLLPLVSSSNVKVKILGEGYVTSQNPPAGTRIQENMTIELNLE